MTSSSYGISAQPRQTLSGLLDEQNSWANYSLFGESIPHLLHWDWAYLWVLDRRSEKPQEWRPRIEAWRRLLSMLLLGELQLQSCDINPPFSGYTTKLNLTQVVFAKAQGLLEDLPIAVLSPTVIVRPLPEPNRFGITAPQLATDLPNYYDPRPGDRDRRGELVQMLDLLKTAIRRSGSQLAKSLIPAIENNLTVRLPLQTSTQYPVVPLAYTVPLVERTDASAWEGLRIVDITVKASQGRAPQRLHFVPRCSSSSSCRELLTYGDAEQAVDVTDEIRLRCGSCDSTTTVPLDELGIWIQGNTVYVWRELEQLEGLSQVQTPPPAEVAGDVVHFRWNPISLGGEDARVSLRLRFPQRQIRGVGISEIRYGELLVPGKLDRSFRGLPIRPEWLFAIEQMPESEVVEDVICFRNMRLRGLSYVVGLGRYPRSACRIRADLQFGVYPGPLHPEWKRYRFFWSGSDGSEYRACVVPAATRPDVRSSPVVGSFEWNDVLPDAVALQTTNYGDMSAKAGATWVLERPLPSTSSQAIYLGVDFGTTSSVVYAQSEDSQPVALELTDFNRAAKLIAGSGEAQAWFLPRPSGRGPSGADPNLIPSALWFDARAQFNPIRWSEERPSAAHVAEHGFKWGLQNEAQRAQYLDELVFLALPATLRKLFPNGGTKGSWNIGFAFPLAFSDTQRTEYARVFNVLRSQIDAYTSGPINIRSVNESYACVKASGDHLQGSVFLIADLGGGSLDVALTEVQVTADGQAVPKHFQVGSAKIGGEAFVEALARRIGTDDDSRKRQYWSIRQAIMHGRVAHEFPGANFGNIASKFLPIAQEYLRTMLEAFRMEFPNREVELVLVGNGWRIIEFTAASPLGEQAGRQELEQSFQRFGISKVAVYKGQLQVPSKHLVALGALSNAKTGGHNEVAESYRETRMPAGLDIRLLNSGDTIHWNDLVGPAVSNLPLGTGTGHIEIKRDSGPVAKPSWLQRLTFALPNLDSNPADAYIRVHLGISGVRLDRGPLQVILEKRAEDLA